MPLSRLPGTFAGLLITSHISSILAMGSPGCSNFNLGNVTQTPNGNPYGFLLNTDTTSDMLGAVRLPDGREVFAYGTFQSDGNIGELKGASMRDADGNESEVVFDGGLISSAAGPDGSTLKVTYTTRTDTHLAGSVDIFIAPLNQTQTITFDADLQQALADLAAQVQQLTGQTISDQPPPPNPAGKVKAPDGPVGPRNKQSTARGSLIVLFFSPYFAYAFASIGLVLVQVMAKMIQVMFTVLVDVIVGLTRAMVVAVMTPFLLLGDLMRAAPLQTIIALSFLSDFDSTVIIPHHPHF